jgi:hypothetical protein
MINVDDPTFRDDILGTRSDGSPLDRAPTSEVRVTSVGKLRTIALAACAAGGMWAFTYATGVPSEGWVRPADAIFLDAHAEQQAPDAGNLDAVIQSFEAYAQTRGIDAESLLRKASRVVPGTLRRDSLDLHTLAEELADDDIRAFDSDNEAES